MAFIRVETNYGEQTINTDHIIRLYRSGDYVYLVVKQGDNVAEIRCYESYKTISCRIELAGR